MRWLSAFAILTFCALVLCIDGQDAKASDRFGYIPSSLIYKFETVGKQVEQIQITNNSSENVVYTGDAEQYRILTPEEIASGKCYADISWILVTPNKLELPPNGKGYFNVEVNIPDGTVDSLYITYIRVFDGIEQEYVTVKIYIGKAIPVHSYAIDPGWFKLEASGDGDKWSKELEVVVKNTGTADTNYNAWGRLPDDPENIDPEYLIGDPSWVDVITPNIFVKSGEDGEVRFRVHVPDSVESGRYKIWLGIRDVDQESQIKIEYASKLFVNVVDKKSTDFMKIVGVVFGVIVITLIGGVLIYVIRNKTGKIERSNISERR